MGKDIQKPLSVNDGITTNMIPCFRKFRFFRFLKKRSFRSGFMVLCYSYVRNNEMSQFYIIDSLTKALFAKNTPVKELIFSCLKVSGIGFRNFLSRLIIALITDTSNRMYSSYYT